jgi:DNA-binding transcriptional regulator YdaS (Cro superfamily)
MTCMTPASQIIERLGGYDAVAELLGITRNAVQRWVYPTKEQRSSETQTIGLGDRVPMKHWTAIVAKSGGKVTLAELMSEEVAQIVTVANAQPKRRRRAAA